MGRAEMQRSEECLVLEFLAGVATLSCLDQKFAHGKMEFCVLMATAGKNRLGVKVEVKAMLITLGRSGGSGGSDLSGKTLMLWVTDLGLNPIFVPYYL